MNAAPERSGWSSWGLSILLHLLAIGVVVGVAYWRSAPPRVQQLAIEASVVTSLPAGPPPTSIPEPAAEPAPQPETVPEPAPEPVAEPQPDPVAVAAEKARRETQRKTEQKRLANEREAARRKTEQAAKEKAAREKADREKAAKEKAEHDKAERDRVAREKAEKEKSDKEKAEQERRQHEQLLAEQARLQRESELNAQIAAEERVAAARAGAAGRQYIAQIAARIEGAWKRPPGATPGTQCEIRVTQIQSGVVTGVQVTHCNRDEIVRQSIEDAVNRASPLPQPSDPALFDRNLTITFRPEN